MILSPESEFRLQQIAREAEELDADQLRKVLVRTWRLWLIERQFMKEAMALEGIHMECEAVGAHPREMVARLAARS